MQVIWALRQAEYFLREDWTTQISLKSLVKFAVLRDTISLGGARHDQSGRAEKPN
jgi:hypothetical protein